MGWDRILGARAPERRGGVCGMIDIDEDGGMRMRIRAEEGACEGGRVVWTGANW